MSILTFYHSDESSSIDSNSRRIVEIKNGDTIEKHVGHVWNVLTVDEKYLMYCESEVAENFITQYGYQFRSASRSFFYSCYCKCLINPSMQSCVNIITSSIQHYMRAISKYMRTHKEIRDKLTDTT